MAYRLGKTTLAIAVKFFNDVASELNPYTTEDSVVRVKNKNSVEMLTPDHIQFAKYGRGAGKKPPLDPIFEWVSKEGIIFDGMTVEGTAFAIQNAIGRRGTLNYVPNAPNALEEAFDKYIEDFHEATNFALVNEIDLELQKIYKKSPVIGKTVNFKI